MNGDRKEEWRIDSSERQYRDLDSPIGAQRSWLFRRRKARGCRLKAGLQVRKSQTPACTDFGTGTYEQDLCYHADGLGKHLVINSPPAVPIAALHARPRRHTP